MAIEIKPLNPDMGETFTDYVANLDFHHAPHWQFCNCQYYHVKCSTETWRARTAEMNQVLAQQNIQNGVMHGFVAFDDDKMVGWVNANDWRNYALLEDDKQLQALEGKTGLVICFLIHPEYRRQGLSSRLLKTAVDNFREEGFDRVMGRPFTWKTHPERQYHGVPIMFEELGFEKISEVNGEITYLLELK